MRFPNPSYSVSRTHEVHLGGAGGIAPSDHETSRRSRGASAAAPQNLKAVSRSECCRTAELRGDRERDFRRRKELL